MDPYLLAKWLHILSSTVLFGTGIGTAFQMVWAMRSRDGRVIHQVARGVVMADWLFTTPAGVIQPATGLWLIHLQGWSPTEPWLLATYALYALAFLCWAPVVHLQIRIRDLTANGSFADGDLCPDGQQTGAWLLIRTVACSGEPQKRIRPCPSISGSPSLPPPPRFC